jgi:hypothetical protein
VKMRVKGRVGAALFAVLLASAACARGSGAKSEETPEPRPDPIPVHVRNENFLDMNIAVVVSGQPRRLGTVAGNSTGNFTIAWSVANGQSIILTASPIGGRGSASSGQLNVGVGQVIDFKLASVLRQSVASVHEPR